MPEELSTLAGAAQEALIRSHAPLPGEGITEAKPTSQLEKPIIVSMRDEHMRMDDSRIGFTVGNYGYITNCEIEWAFVANFEPEADPNAPPSHLGIREWPGTSESLPRPRARRQLSSFEAERRRVDEPGGQRT